ncbi:hypothetical protein [Actinomadura rudentiformis]|uniref:GrpB family protein n=1 Tax=Actinomadura rudentiformis TaxID=359158 RepID=A0A6H9Z216_9ACTN|nr:hypothetical protein [Actinomadura rudentiformis]KAB2347307.1 GrpB family protein [Actinomadura rudentiformis]
MTTSTAAPTLQGLPALLATAESRASWAAYLDRLEAAGYGSKKDEAMRDYIDSSRRRLAACNRGDGS